MRRSIHLFGVVVAAALIFALTSPSAQAGRIGGPLSTVSAVPVGTSVFFDIPFGAGDPAVVTVAGDGDGTMNVLLQDADGHIAIGTGTLNRRTVSMDVYRGGMFRVEVRNLGPRELTFTLTTN